MTKPYQSRIDSELLVTPGNWVLSLVAKAKGKNPEHAFLIVEGLSSDWKSVYFRRYDFVIDNKPSGLDRAVRNSGRVVIKKVKNDRSQYDEEALAFFFWSSLMSDDNAEQQCHGLSWHISPNEAAALQRAIKQDQANPPDYHILGARSLVAASSSQSGDNCYTWARRKVRDLGNERIRGDALLTSRALDFIVSQTTRHLKPAADPNQKPSVEPERRGCKIM